ncbi:hypothetical protein ACFVT1_15300 [Streptomyces sp. NPDC057963]|uniref:hypothetical protein n=1 Tax=Streptomyces sp. NPDC057963 TaxID=3346290 RepID=UPI0036E987CC
MFFQSLNPTQVHAAINSARREVILTLPGEFTWDDNSEDFAAACSAGKSELRVRVFAAPATKTSRTSPEKEIARLGRTGVEFLRIPESVTRMAVIDRRTLVVARNKCDYSEGALIGQNLPFAPLIATSLVSRLPPPSDATAPSRENPLREPRVQDVLQQLAQGATDEAAARELGMALRTYRRVVSRLMTQLQARSRFQAGLIAAQRNWL